MRGDGDRVATSRFDEASYGPVRGHLLIETPYGGASVSPRPLRATVSLNSFAAA